jgi:hypothetical protein
MAAAALALAAAALTVGISGSILKVWRLQTEVGQIRDHQATSQIAVNSLTQQLSEAQKRSQDLMEQLGQQQQSRQHPSDRHRLVPSQRKDFGVKSYFLLQPSW